MGLGGCRKIKGGSGSLKRLGRRYREEGPELGAPMPRSVPLSAANSDPGEALGLCPQPSVYTVGMLDDREDPLL